jgi:hypothetical protein
MYLSSADVAGVFCAPARMAQVIDAATANPSVTLIGDRACIWVLLCFDLAENSYVSYLDGIVPKYVNPCPQDFIKRLSIISQTLKNYSIPCSLVPTICGEQTKPESENDLKPSIQSTDACSQVLAGFPQVGEVRQQAFAEEERIVAMRLFQSIADSFYLS